MTGGVQVRVPNSLPLSKSPERPDKDVEGS